ncbi:putative ADP-ribosylation factor GTPase-activating protein AGD11 [Platanthera guangdongensis]|uniref:ADP-ribosylation factor GTPase-activating protein AGD11 n=1 Tax=Platanthera guangdongensis TaxID=2320717 RepID=A0ABR2MRU4_9ASPA
MDGLLGLLRVRVLRGVDLAVRDLKSSDPYVVLQMGKQKLRTRVIKKSLNPEWNEELTLSVEDPTLPIKLKVYDRDRFSFDDPMGDAEFDIHPFFLAVKMMNNSPPPPPPSSSTSSGLVAGSVIIKQLLPNRRNCLAEESSIRADEHGTILQDMFLRLRNVECGEIQLQLQWIHLPPSKSLRPPS